MAAIGLIPTRLESERLPRKALLPLDGLPVIVHTFLRAQLARSLAQVFVCTDSEEIESVVGHHGGHVIMTSPKHRNGTERIAEAADMLRERGLIRDTDFIVDVQGDEPLLDPAHIDAVVEEHRRHDDWDILVPTLRLSDPETPHVVKVIHDVCYRIMAMSRYAIPMSFRADAEFHLRHLDSISFRPAALRRFSALVPSRLEMLEGIELLRALENGMILGTIVLKGESYSLNVPQDYERAKRDILNDAVRRRY